VQEHRPEALEELERELDARKAKSEVSPFGLLPKQRVSQDEIFFGGDNGTYIYTCSIKVKHCVAPNNDASRYLVKHRDQLS